LALALMTCAQSRNRVVTVDSIVTNKVFRAALKTLSGSACPTRKFQ